MGGVNPFVRDLDLLVDHGVADHHYEGGHQVLEEQAGVHIHQAGGPWGPALIIKMRKDDTLGICTS